MRRISEEEVQKVKDGMVTGFRRSVKAPGETVALKVKESEKNFFSHLFLSFKNHSLPPTCLRP
jgi:hypothetical protein